MSTARFALVWVIAYAIVVASAMGMALTAHRDPVSTLAVPLVIVTCGLGVSVAKRRRREPPP
ncbi:hypothetical protein [Clavibacter michiganensis]|uniref:hypothetical protein n=1 Tax=Clavibacter michiganensis TaxID=28447 RepID=UPI00375832C1